MTTSRSLSPLLSKIKLLLEKCRGSDNQEEARTAAWALVQLIIKHDLVISERRPEYTPGSARIPPDIDQRIEDIFNQFIARASKMRNAAMHNEGPSLAKVPGRCWLCGDLYPVGSPVVQLGETMVHRKCFVLKHDINPFVK